MICYDNGKQGALTLSRKVWGEVKPQEKQSSCTACWGGRTPNPVLKFQQLAISCPRIAFLPVSDRPVSAI